MRRGVYLLTVSHLLAAYSGWVGKEWVGRMTADEHSAPQEAQFHFYSGPHGDLDLQVLYLAGNVWLAEQRLAEVWGIPLPELREHIAQVYASQELDPAPTRRLLRLAQPSAGQPNEVMLYSLDLVIAVSYRVDSPQARQFRQWATHTLRELMTKGFSIEAQRLGQGSHMGRDYYHLLLARIADIRSNERIFHQQITSLYATASDYQANAEASRDLYRSLQNKLHYATHGYTAPELIARRADARQPHMGLTSWGKSPRDAIRKSDAVIAKNYLTEAELQQLNRMVAAYGDYAELYASRHQPMTMADWATRIDAFLEFYEYPILTTPSRITPDAAKSIAEQEYAKFQQHQIAMQDRHRERIS
jgi:hypothetical protein